MSINKNFQIDRSKYDDANFNSKSKYVAKPGITEELVRKISSDKNEPDWMLKKRLRALDLFMKTQMPKWGPDLSKLDLNEIIYYVDPDVEESRSWDDVPEEIKQTFEKLGIPQAEREALAGVGGQYDSGMVYHNLKEEWEKQGIIFENMDVAVHKYPELVKKYFMTNCVPITDHKFAMLHAAVWSGGTFIYIPEGVSIDMPLQAYFRMNAMKGGQFEHTLIIADKGSEMHYIEGCSSPKYESSSLHAGCVEIHVMEGAKVKYSSIENWSKNMYNLNTKRAIVHKKGKIDWLNGQMGCLVGETKVFTPNGIKNIEKISKGDEIFSWNEKSNSYDLSKVLNKINSGIKKIYGLKVAGREILASGNHPFLTLNRKKKNPEHKKAFFNYEWKNLEDLREGDVVGVSKKINLQGKSFKLPKIELNTKIQSSNQYSSFESDSFHLYNNEINLPEYSNEDLMWLLGLFLGDGNLDLKNNKVKFATYVKEDYRGHLEEILFNLFNYKVTEKKEYYVIINSKKIGLLFKELGFDGNALTKRVPDWIFSLTREEKLAFLAGYFDADGHANNNGVYLTSVSKDGILENVKLLALELGFGVSRIFEHRKAGMREILGKEINANNSWRLLLNGPNIVELPSRCLKKKKIVDSIISKRNFSKVGRLNFKSKTSDYLGFAKIDEIREIGERETFDIEVENNHNFIANGIIVHNSHRTMLYPCSILLGEGSKTESLGIAFAGEDQDQDTGTKVIHLGANTSSILKSKSISKDGGISSYRGLVKIGKSAKNAISSVECDALMIDDQSVSNTFPLMEVEREDAQLIHEAKVGKIGDDEIFYLMARGFTEEQAKQMIVTGFAQEVIKKLPLEYAVELNKLIELEMEDSLG